MKLVEISQSELLVLVALQVKVSKIAPLNIKIRLEPSSSRPNIKGAVEEMGVSVARRSEKD